MSLQNQLHQPYGSPAPQAAHPALPFQSPGTGGWGMPSPIATPARQTRPSARPSTVRGTPQQSSYASMPYSPAYAQTAPPPPPPASRGPLPTKPQAMVTSYGSRLRTGVTLLMQPINPTGASSGGAASSAVTATVVGTRRRGHVNYAEVGSGDEMEVERERDREGLDSDDSDFVASGSTRGAVRRFGGSTGSGAQGKYGVAQKQELDQSYLGQLPPERFITQKTVPTARAEYFSPDLVDQAAEKPVVPVPVRVELETETHRIRDCFVWNLNEELITPQSFARTFCSDLDLPPHHAEQVTNQIRAQLEEHGVVAGMPLGGISNEEVDNPEGVQLECRVIVGLDVQISTQHLIDHFEWDLLSSLTPEAFAQTLCADLGLSSESLPLISHAIHEDLLKHKKDAIEWGVLDASLTMGNTADLIRGHGPTAGLGGAWGKRGRGPKKLRSVWRDWMDANIGEFMPRLEELSVEELERREIEKERASRRLRRETSKFQTTTRRRR